MSYGTKVLQKLLLARTHSVCLKLKSQVKIKFNNNAVITLFSVHICGCFGGLLYSYKIKMYS